MLIQYGLSEGTIISAIDVLSETEDKKNGIKTRDVWGVYEVIDGKETVTFTGFAYTEEELASKSEIFLASVRNMKEFLEGFIESAGRGMIGSETWNV